MTNSDLNNYDKMILRKCDRYNKSNSGMKIFTPLELISDQILRLSKIHDLKNELRLSKIHTKKFNEPYTIRYNKQLLHLILGAEN